MPISEKLMEAEERHRIRDGFDRILEILDRAVPWTTACEEQEVKVLGLGFGSAIWA